MGFVGTSNIILNYDVNINEKSIMSFDAKINDIKSYREDDGIEIINPTIMICNHFKNKIGYCLPSPLLWVLDNMELKPFYQPLNCHRFNTYNELVNYLGDRRRKIYLSKIVKDMFCWKAYIIEIDNTPNIREEKLKEIGI